MHSQDSFYLGELAAPDVKFGHGVEPGLAQLWRAGVALGQWVLQVNEELRVILVLLHLSGGHQDRADSLCQVPHLTREWSFLINKMGKMVWDIDI